jgi:ABC-type thiamine transport system ATPase subunit
LTADLVRIGYKVAETMIELFSGLPPGHEFFEQYSFIRHEDLPGFKEILSRTVESDLGTIADTDRDQLLALPFKLIQARHRLGLIDEALEERIVEARRYFASHLPEELKGAVEFFDPGRYNIAASLQDNILFGKVVTAQAQAGAKVGALLRQVLDDLGLRPLVVRIGLDYQVGVGGARLPAPERQKVALARAILKRPVALILDRVLAVLDPAAQVRVMTRVLEHRRGRSVIWVLENNDLAERFEQVLVIEHGRLAERGSVAELKQRGGALQMLLAAGG